MKNLRILLLSFVVINSSLAHGQRNELTYRKLIKTSKYVPILNNDSLRPYYISSSPITNIEYITFLCWIANVYVDYPDELLSVFPGLDGNHIDSLDLKNFNIEQFSLLINSSKLNRDYIFNPKFLYYPVVGITWNQAMKFCFWLSDRYNESEAIRRGLLNLIFCQIDAGNFNTEAYISDQYQGIIAHLIFDSTCENGERSAKWQDRIFYPSFRLPSKQELNLVSASIENSIKQYKPNPFLKPWIKNYITENGNDIKLLISSFHNTKTTILAYSDVQPPKNDNKYELSLDLELPDNEYDIFKIFQKFNSPVFSIDSVGKQLSKDSLGHMPYVIISEDKNLKPICIQRNVERHHNVDYQDKEFKIFRYSMSAILK